MPFAAFFDILGTSRIFTGLADDYRFEGDEWEYGGYAYARREFHRGLEAAVDLAPRGFLFRASFSDCGYLIYDDPASLLLAAGTAIRWFYRCAPVRGGIGYGNFGLGTTLHSSNARGTSTEASFFGSALVRAHAAEACGLKGLRALVHDSAAYRLSNVQGVDFVCPIYDYMQHEEGDERPPTLPATVIRLATESAQGVSHELCFIGHDDTDRYFRSLEMLQRQFPPDGEALQHYQRSKEALHYFQSLRMGNLTRR